MTPLETYLRELRDIRSSGAAVKETSYYPALSNLFNEVGKRLKPRVRCIINLANRGVGIPDGGLFTAEQFQKPSEPELLPGQLPARGVIEVKSTKDDAWITADGEQVSRYWGKYRQVLVTNYRDFVLVGQDAEGKFAKLESFHLADSEKAFWAAAAHPSSLAKKIERTVRGISPARHAARCPVSRAGRCCVVSGFLCSGWSRRALRVWNSPHWRPCARRWKKPWA